MTLDNFTVSTRPNKWGEPNWARSFYDVIENDTGMKYRFSNSDIFNMSPAFIATLGEEAAAELSSELTKRENYIQRLKENYNELYSVVAQRQKDGMKIPRDWFVKLQNDFEEMHQLDMNIGNFGKVDKDFDDSIEAVTSNADKMRQTPAETPSSVSTYIPKQVNNSMRSPESEAPHNQLKNIQDSLVEDDDYYEGMNLEKSYEDYKQRQDAREEAWKKYQDLIAKNPERYIPGYITNTGSNGLKIGGDRTFYDPNTDTIQLGRYKLPNSDEEVDAEDVIDKLIHEDQHRAQLSGLSNVDSTNPRKPESKRQVLTTANGLEFENELPFVERDAIKAQLNPKNHPNFKRFSEEEKNMYKSMIKCMFLIKLSKDGDASSAGCVPSQTAGYINPTDNGYRNILFSHNMRRKNRKKGKNKKKVFMKSEPIVGGTPEVQERKPSLERGECSNCGAEYQIGFDTTCWNCGGNL